MSLVTNKNKSYARPYKCPFTQCLKKYKNFNGLKYHINDKHLPKNQKVPKQFLNENNMVVCPAHNKIYSNKSSKHDLCVKHHNNLNGNSNKKVNNNVTISDAPLNELPLSDNKNEKDPPKKYIPLKQNMLNNLK